MLKKNSGETKLHQVAPCIKYPNAFIGLITLGLSSHSTPEFLTEYESVLLVGQCLCFHFACRMLWRNFNRCRYNSVSFTSNSISSSSSISSNASGSNNSNSSSFVVVVTIAFEVSVIAIAVRVAV